MARIGLCEDDPAIRRIVLAALSHADHVGISAHDGLEALRLFAEDDTLDAIILDIGLPTPAATCAWRCARQGRQRQCCS